MCMHILPIIMSLCDYLSVCLWVITWEKLTGLKDLAEAFFNSVWPYIPHLLTLLLVEPIISTSLLGM